MSLFSRSANSLKPFPVLLYAALSFFICVIGLLRPGFTPVKGELHSMVEGTQMQPFVRRALVPFVIRGIERVVPAAVQERISGGVMASMPFAATFFKSPAEVFRKSCAVLLIWLSMWGFSLFFYYLYVAVYPRSGLIVSLFPLVALTVLPVHFFRAFMLYDIPGLFFTTACLYFLLKERWGWYYLCFLLAAVNKESSVFLITVFLFMYFGKYASRRLALHVLAQALIWSAVFLSLFLLYRHNPGDVFEFALVRNLLAWKVAYGLIGGLQMITYGALLFFALLSWKERPRVVRRMFLGLTPLFLMSLFVGYIEELRVYYEIFPVIMLLLLPSVFPSTASERTDGSAESAISRTNSGAPQ
jgi:hypothetical protein